MLLTSDQQFNVELNSGWFTVGKLGDIPTYVAPNSSTQTTTLKDKDVVTVVEYYDADPRWVRLSPQDQTIFISSWWIYTAIDGDKASKDCVELKPVKKEDKERYAELQEIEPSFSDNGNNYTDAIDYDSDIVDQIKGVSSNLVYDTTSKGDEYVVGYDALNDNTYSDQYNTYILLAVKAYGAPPQWTRYVDPRILSVQNNLGLEINVGRKYAETIISKPTIISLCPGVVKYNSMLGEIAQSNILTGDGLDDKLEDIVKSESSGQLIEFQPCWYADVEGGNYGYIKYVNTLCRIAAIAMSREVNINAEVGNAATKLGDRIFPGTNTPYKDFDWVNYDEKDNDITSLFGDGSLNNIFDIDLKSSVAEYKYINFFGVGQNNVREDFSTDVRSTALEDVVAGNLTSSLRDVAFYTGGIIGDAAEQDFENLVDGMSDKLGGLGNLLKSGTELMKGGHMVFPKVIDDCTYGKSMSFTCRFISTSANVEERFLNTIVPYMHILPFILPRQVKGLIDMYTTPFLVRGFSKGLFSCNVGVLSNFQTTKGGSDDCAWTSAGEPTEIEVQFDVTPLYTKLVMSSQDQLSSWFLRNFGLQEYMMALCGVDMRMSQFALKVEIASGLAKGWITSIPENINQKVLHGEWTNWLKNILTF